MARIWKSPFVRLAGYYVLLGAAVWLLITLFPAVPQLLERFRAISAIGALGGKGRELGQLVTADSEALSQGEWALVTLLSMLAALALVLPVAWVYITTKQRRGYDQSVVQAVIVLPMTVAGTVILVQNSLALAFALAAIVAAVRFRNTLKDTKDAVYIFLALGVGVAAGVFAPAVAAVMSAVFSAVILLLWKFNVGNIYADQGTRAAPLMLAETLVGPGKGGESAAIGDPELLAALSPDELETVAAQASRLRQYIEARAGAKKKKRFNAVVLVHAAQPEAAQREAEAVLEEQAKRWQLAEILPREGGGATLEYLVRLGDGTVPAALLESIRARGAPHVAAAEYRSLRGMGKQQET